MKRAHHEDGPLLGDPILVSDVGSPVKTCSAAISNGATHVSSDVWVCFHKGTTLSLGKKGTLQKAPTHTAVLF